MGCSTSPVSVADVVVPSSLPLDEFPEPPSLSAAVEAVDPADDETVPPSEDAVVSTVLADDALELSPPVSTVASPPDVPQAKRAIEPIVSRVVFIHFSSTPPQPR
jgi:hypothetical protein